ncbi:MAG: SRPBCC domain-containing protein [Candidatus Gracilibacteria bacterium]
MQHSIQINASKEKVWDVLWSDKSFRDWANIIDEGTYIDGDLQEGKEVNVMSASGYGVTVKVEKLTPYQFLLFKQVADIKVGKDGAVEKREKEWEGGSESYELKEKEGKVELIITEDVPENLVEYFDEKLPEVLERIKVLAEAK